MFLVSEKALPRFACRLVETTGVMVIHRYMIKRREDFVLLSSGMLNILLLHSKLFLSETNVSTITR